MMQYLLFAAAAWASVAAAGDVPPANYLMKWKSFVEKYNKVYANGDEERRFEIFKTNVDKIYAENKAGHAHQFGVNEFADMTADEFAATYIGGFKPALQSNDLQAVPFNITGPVPNSVDWVTKGGVTPVKNQQRCGSCWAFSTTGSTEGAYFVASGSLVSLSEEDLVQCDHNGDQGCQGGLMDNAFAWIQQNGGICSEESYPYTSGTGTTGTCKKGCTPVVTVSGHVDVPARDEDALKKAVAQQPVSVAIEADKSAFQLYSTGVLDDSGCGTKLDHGVLIVGYGTDATSGKDYWKVKNSWGATWGEKGYVRIARGKNMCGIAEQASYPTGAKKAVSSLPSSPSTSHYEDPKDGCQSDEVDISIQGVDGKVCAPSCSSSSCPTDLPTGVTAKPQCALQDASSGKKYCALICSPSGNDDQCGSNASCKSIQTVGICTYDDDTKVKATLATDFKKDSEEVVV